MKSIGHIYLSWRPDAESPRILVGVIKNSANEGVRFTYLADGVLEALPLGFVPYKGFPDPIEVYTKNVLRIFGHRILLAAGDDIQSYFDFWGVHNEYKSKPFYMLAYTQGMLPTDNFEFLASFNPKKDFSLVTEMCDLNDAGVAGAKLSEGDMLRFVSEPSKTNDKYAIKLFKGSVALGYVKVVHSRIFSKAKKLEVRVHKVEQIADKNKVFIKISMPS